MKTDTEWKERPISHVYVVYTDNTSDKIAFPDSQDTSLSIHNPAGGSSTIRITRVESEKPKYKVGDVFGDGGNVIYKVEEVFKTGDIFMYRFGSLLYAMSDKDLELRGWRKFVKVE